MPGAFAGGDHSVVAGDTRRLDVSVVETGRAPCRRGMAVIATCARWNMCGWLARLGETSTWRMADYARTRSRLEVPTSMTGFAT